MVDRPGRTGRLLHGLQVDKWIPGTHEEGYVDLSPAAVRFLGAVGFNLARVAITYTRIEPSPGRFDDAYVGRYLRLDGALDHAGVYDLLSLMQGEYSSVVGGNGFPAWMALTNGAVNTRQPFAGGYLSNPAEEAVWDNFWANVHTAGAGLQDHFARGLGRLCPELRRRPRPARARDSQRAVARNPMGELLRGHGLPRRRLRPDGADGVLPPDHPRGEGGRSPPPDRL